MLPDTRERAQQELVFQIDLGAPLMATKGYAAPEVEHAYTRAWEISQQMGETPQVFPVIWGLCAFYLQRADHERARQFAEQLLSVAQNLQNPTFLPHAHYMLACSLFYLGEFVSAQAHFAQGIALYDLRHQGSHTFLSGQDLRVSCRTLTALSLWILGYPHQAREQSREALIQAHQSDQPFRLAWALNFAAMLSQYGREEREVHDRAEAKLRLASEKGFPYWLALGSVWRGWALAEQGQVEEGVTQIHQGLAAYSATGAELSRPHFLALQAEGYARGEQVKEGLSVVEQALADVHKTGERYYEAELYRLKGELTLQQGFKGQSLKVKVADRYSLTPYLQGEAEACFLKAIDIARQQHAKSWELRASTSLARLWQRQGKVKEAHHQLSEVYGWFTEGFDTKDLQEAKVLLEELS